MVQSPTCTCCTLSVYLLVFFTRTGSMETITGTLVRRLILFPNGSGHAIFPSGSRPGLHLSPLALLRSDCHLRLTVRLGTPSRYRNSVGLKATSCAANPFGPAVAWSIVKRVALALPTVSGVLHNISRSPHGPVAFDRPGLLGARKPSLSNPLPVGQVDLTF